MSFATLPLPLASAPVIDDDAGAYDIVLGGVGYMLDYSVDRHGEHSVETLKPQSDQGAQVGASSLNPQGLWPVTLSEWHLGAGQRFFDKPVSDARRFRASKNIDVWTEGQLQSLYRTLLIVTAANYNLALTPAGNRMYVAGLSTGKNQIEYWDATVSSSTTGEPGSDVKAMATDGFHVMAAFSGDGIYLSDTTSSAFASWITGEVNLVGYAKGRVMAAAGNRLYNVTTAFDTTAALPTPLFTHSNPDFTWVDFAEGLGQIYAAGVSGGRSEIYRIAVVAEGTSLGAPTVAGRLPDGETIHAIFGYASFLLIGTDQGFRLAEERDSGDLSIGALVETGSPVRDFAARGRFVWFTWEFYDEGSSGVGRIDLQTLTDVEKLVPAYASDLMYTSAGLVPTVAIFGEDVMFGVGDHGIIREDRHTQYPATADAGTIESGEIAFDLAQVKVVVRVVVDAIMGDGDDSVLVEMRADGGIYQTIGTVSSTGVSTFNPTIEGSRLEMRLTLDCNGDTSTPTVNLVQVFVHPRTEGTAKIILPINLRDDVDRRSGAPTHYDPNVELERLIGWWKAQEILALTRGDRTQTVVIEDYQWAAENQSPDHSADHGLFYAECKVIDDRMDP